jgi:hypothetical protein
MFPVPKGTDAEGDVGAGEALQGVEDGAVASADDDGVHALLDCVFGPGAGCAACSGVGSFYFDSGVLEDALDA